MKKQKVQLGGNVEKKLDAITLALGKMATKDDLKKFAIKESLDDLTAKVDGLASNLDGLTTKVDGLAKTVTRTSSTVDGLTQAVSGIIGSLTKMATKDELKKMEKRLETKFVTKDHFDNAVSLLVTKNEFDDFKEYVVENMYTKVEQEVLITSLDPMRLEFRNAERVNKLTGKQHCEMNDKIDSYDKRIKWLERGRTLQDGSLGGLSI